MQTFWFSLRFDFIAERGCEDESEVKGEGKCEIACKYEGRGECEIKVRGTWGPSRGGAKARHASLTAATAAGHLQCLRIPPGTSLLCCITVWYLPFL